MVGSFRYDVAHFSWDRICYVLLCFLFFHNMFVIGISIFWEFFESLLPLDLTITMNLVPNDRVGFLNWLVEGIEY